MLNTNKYNFAPQVRIQADFHSLPEDGQKMRKNDIGPIYFPL